jgi:DNA-binding IclR family transcriptional regulator
MNPELSTLNEVPPRDDENSEESAPTDTKEMNRGVDVQVIARAADILNAIGDRPEGLSLAQIAAIVDLSRSTVHRIVVALCRQDFLLATNSGYKLGPALLHLADASRSNFQISVRPYLEELCADLHETVDLSEITGPTVTFVDQVIAQRRLRAVSATGLSFPLHCTAPGKAILASLDPDVAERLLPDVLERYSPSTVTDRAALMRELDDVRRDGVAFDREEHTIGICAVGMALRAPSGAWYAVSVPLPTQRFYGQEARLVEALSSCVARIVRDLVSTDRTAGVLVSGRSVRTAT